MEKNEAGTRDSSTQSLGLDMAYVSIVAPTVEFRACLSKRRNDRVRRIGHDRSLGRRMARTAVDQCTPTSLEVLDHKGQPLGIEDI